MSTNPARTPILVGVAATVVLLITAAVLTPGQSPILPIEISVVLIGLTAWFALRGSRLSLGAVTVFAALLVLLSLHILTGDAGSSGAREIVPDVLILASTAFVAARGALLMARR